MERMPWYMARVQWCTDNIERLNDEQRNLAVVMAAHHRLGSGSILNRLPADLMQHIAPNVHAAKPPYSTPSR